MIDEGKAEGFDKRLFNLIIDSIVIGGMRSDGVDDPKSLHFELNVLNLDTDMMTRVDEKGNLRYTIDRDIENIEDENEDESDDFDLCTFYRDFTR